MHFSSIIHQILIRSHVGTSTKLYGRITNIGNVSGKFKMEGEVEINGHLNFEKNLCDLKYLDEFPIENSSSLTYNQFFEKYLSRNQACLIRNVSNHWDSSRFWVKSGSPDFCYLSSKYGDRNVSVQECKREDDYLQKRKPDWKFGEYMKYWEETISNGYPSDTPLYYLKDWHLKNESPDDDFYEVPLYFASDWINEYLVENCKDDYRFIYMGIKGTW